MVPSTMQTVTRLPTTLDSRSVKACWAPMTSLFRRADQGPGLRAGVEGQGHPLDVPEHLRAHVENQPFTDGGGNPAFGEGQPGVEDGQGRHQDGQPDDQVGVAPKDPVVDELPEDEWVDRADGGVEHHHR